MEKYAKKWPLGTKREAGAGNGGRPVPGVVCVVHGCALDTAYPIRNGVVVDASVASMDQMGYIWYIWVQIFCRSILTGEQNVCQNRLSFGL